MKTQAKRDFGFDNIKFILIFCVVLGHFLEFCRSGAGNFLYRLIYLFHMPLFLFVSGYFAKFDKKKIVFDCLGVYIIFQILYVVFQGIVLKSRTDLLFTYPYWIMWYPLVITFYSILLPLYKAESTKKRLSVLLIVFALSLFIGYEKSVEYPLSLSRFFVFQPYFLMGHYFKTEEESIKNKFLSFNLKKKYIFFTLLIIFTALLSYHAVSSRFITNKMLYGAIAYINPTDIFIRAELYVIGLCWIFLFIFLIKPLFSTSLPIISTIGKNTLPIFLIHGFIMKLGAKEIIPFNDNIFLVLLYTILVLLLLGNDYAARAVNLLFPWRWRIFTKK